MKTFSDLQIDEAKLSAPEVVHDFIYSGSLADRIESMVRGKELKPEEISVLIDSIRNSILGLLSPEDARGNLQEAKVPETIILEAIGVIGEVLKSASSAPKTAASTEPELKALHDAEKAEGHLLAEPQKPAASSKEPIQIDLDAPAPTASVSKIIPAARPISVIPAPTPSAPARPPVSIPRVRTMVSDVEAMEPAGKTAPAHAAAPQKPAMPKPPVHAAVTHPPVSPAAPKVATPTSTTPAPKAYGADPYREPVE